MSLEKESRRYNVSDPNMKDVARRYMSQFPNYYNSFKNLDEETFHETFLADFTAKVETVADMPSDNMMMNQLASETEDVNEDRAEAVSLLGRTRYFVKKAAKGDKRFVNQFGYNKLDDARDSNKKMTSLLEDFNVAVNEKRAELIEAKMPESLMLDLEVLEASIKQERTEQVEARIKRSDATIRRISLLNEIWDIMVIITDANRYANPDDAIAAEIFSLPYPAEKTESSEEE